MTIYGSFRKADLTGKGFDGYFFAAALDNHSAGGIYYLVASDR
jgi:hypothetical protein